MEKGMRPDLTTHQLWHFCENTGEPSVPDTDHHFAQGQYIRTMRVPKNTLVIGKMHRNKTLNILVEGEMLVYMGEDIPAVKLSAPHIFESDAGVQKVGFSLTPVSWVNVIVTDKQDVDEIEKDIYFPDEEVRKAFPAELVENYCPQQLLSFLGDAI